MCKRLLLIFICIGFLYTLVGLVCVCINDKLNGLVTEWKGHSGRQINCVALSTDGKLLATGGDDKRIRIWDFNTHRELAVLECHEDSVNSISITPDSKLLASGGKDGAVIMWDVNTKKPLWKKCIGSPLQENGVRRQSEVFSVLVSSNGSYLATCGDDESVHLFEVSTGKELAVFSGHNDYVYAMAFSHDGKTLFSGSSYGIIKSWDLLTAKEGLSLDKDGQGYGSRMRLSVSPDGKMIADCRSARIQLWSLESNRKSVSLLAPNWFRAVAFSPDSKLLAGAYQWGKLGIWDTSDGTSKSTITTGHCEAVIFHPNNELLVTVGDRIKIWNVKKMIGS